MDVDFLKEAFSMAKMRTGFCAPNPSVGAVIVRNGHIISRGYHWAAGYPHAEVSAVNAAGTSVEGTTIYVTLEPCCFTGRTLACTDFLIKHRVSRVVYGYEDPNPMVSGRGRRKLREAGIDCEHIPLGEIEEFYQSYTYWVRNGIPWVTAKLALSLDGKIAGEGGSPVRITGKESEKLTHRNRAKSDAILTSVRTVIKDNPQLNVRQGEDVFYKPIYIVDRKADFPLDCRLWNTASSLTLFHGSEAPKDKLLHLQDRGAKTLEVSSVGNLLNLPEIVVRLGKLGIHHLWIEAGGTLFRAFVELSLVNQVLIYVSPKWMGERALPAFEKTGELFETAKEIRWSGMGKDVLCEMNW